MPTYEYFCADCGLKFTDIRLMSERLHPAMCPECAGPGSFIISAPMVQVDTAQDVPWLADFAAKRKESRFGHRPIQTRTEYKQYLKDNDLRPASAENLSEV